MRGDVISSEARGCKGLSEILPYIKVPLVPNAHPLQVNPGVGFLCTFEGFDFVNGLAGRQLRNCDWRA